MLYMVCCFRLSSLSKSLACFGTRRAPARDWAHRSPAPRAGRVDRTPSCSARPGSMTLFLSIPSCNRVVRPGGAPANTSALAYGQFCTSQSKKVRTGCAPANGECPLMAPMWAREGAAVLAAATKECRRQKVQAADARPAVPSIRLWVWPQRWAWRSRLRGGRTERGDGEGPGVLSTAIVTNVIKMPCPAV